jgi:hypothetical protein
MIESNGFWKIHALGSGAKAGYLALTYSSLLYKLAGGLFSEHAGGRRYFRLKLYFSHTRPTSSVKEVKRVRSVHDSHPCADNRVAVVEA